MRGIKNVYKILFEKNPERKILLRRPGHRWENKIKINLREFGFGGVDWIHIAQIVQERDQWQVCVHMVMDLLIP